MAKGSQGKTTTAVHLAAGLAARDYRVLLIGCDTQQHCATHLGVSADVGLYEFFKGASLKDAMREVRPNLFLMAGGERNALLKRELNLATEAIEWQIAEVLAPLHPYFHYIIFDNGPNWDMLANNIMYACNEIIAPVTLEPLSMQGLFDHLKRIQRIGTRANCRLAYLLPTMVDKRTLQTRELLAQLEERFGQILCDPIRIDIRLSESPGQGETIWEYSPNSRSAADYTQFVERVINDET